MTFVTRMMSVSLVSVLALSASIHTARASDDNAQALLDQAKALFADRANDFSKVEQARAKLEQAEGEAVDNDLKFAILTVESRVIYTKTQALPGGEENNPAKVPGFDLGRQKADAAIAIDGDSADGWYFYALNLSRWGLAKGKMSSLGHLGELKDHLNKAMAKKIKGTELSGESIDGYGPDRIYGRMYWTLPGIAGGDNNKSLKYLEKTFTNAGDPSKSDNYKVALNVVYYAETLNDVGQKDLAAKILRDLLAVDPAKYNAERVFETRVELVDAKNLLAKIGR
jgi:tetratricopeptide (TPR) repeat protein